MAGGRPEVHRADAPFRCHVHGPHVIVDSDVPADPWRVKVGMLPRGILPGLVVDSLHLAQERDHGEVGIDPFVGAGMRCLAMRRRPESVGSLVSVDDLEHRWLSDNSVGPPLDHLLEEPGSLRDLNRSAVADLFVRGQRDIERGSQVVLDSLLDGGQHRADRSLHVATPASIQPVSADPRLERAVFGAEPGIGWHGVGVGEIRHAAGSGALLADNVDLPDARTIGVIDPLDRKAKPN